MQQRNQVIDKNISQAFEDLSKLMDKVTMSKWCFSYMLHTVGDDALSIRVAQPIASKHGG